MTTMRALAATIILILVTLAGCAEDAPPAEDDDFSDVGGDLKATAATGVIRGVVVDPAIVPIGNVTIELDGTGLSTITDGDGTFGFQDLEPRTYFLKASKEGLLEVQQSATVEAGVDRPDVVKILMDADPDALPFVEDFVFEGIITCSFSLVAFGIAACSTLELEDRFEVEYGPGDLPRTPDWSQSEMIWDSTQAAGDRMSLQYSASGDGTLLVDYAEAQGTSPVLVTANQTTMAEHRVPGANPLHLRVFNAPVEGTDAGETVGDPRDGDDCIERPELGGCMTGVGATIDQRFTVYTHAFFGFVPDEGYRFSQDGAPSVPT